MLFLVGSTVRRSVTTKSCLIDKIILSSYSHDKVSLAILEMTVSGQYNSFMTGWTEIKSTNPRP